MGSARKRRKEKKMGWETMVLLCDVSHRDKVKTTTGSYVPQELMSGKSAGGLHHADRIANIL